MKINRRTYFFLNNVKLDYDLLFNFAKQLKGEYLN